VEFPHLQKIADEYRASGLEVLTLNASDSRATIRRYFESEGFDLKTGLLEDTRTANTLLRQYGVQAFPTNYLIGRDGKVVWRGVGFDEKALRKAIAGLGLTPSQ
jgi:hypothetical protein